MESLRHVLPALALALAVGCGPNPNERLHLPATDPIPFKESFEKWKAQLGRDPRGAYLVEGDMAFWTDEELVQVFRRLDRWQLDGSGAADGPLGQQGSSLAVELDNGMLNTWTAEQKHALSWCATTDFTLAGAESGFEDAYAKVVRAVQVAAVDWMSAADVTFVRAEAEDVRCAPSNTAVLFDVRPGCPDNDGAAVAFVPHQPREERTLFVCLPKLQAQLDAGKTLEGIMRHELGHVLGFAHEHALNPRINGGSNIESCEERQNAGAKADAHLCNLGNAYDGASVMYWRGLRGARGGDDYALSPTDREHVARVYGATPLPEP